MTTVKNVLPSNKVLEEVQNDNFEVIVIDGSQPDKLAFAMRQMKLTQGETILADIDNIRLKKDEEDLVLFFCMVDSITGLRIKETITPGNGGPLTEEKVMIKNFKVPKDTLNGLYNVTNIIVSSTNDCLFAEATEETTYELVELE